MQLSDSDPYMLVQDPLIPFMLPDEVEKLPI